MKRYILVGGNPLTTYNGTTTFTGLSIVGSADTAEECERVTGEQYDACAGLLLWIDTTTGLVPTI